MAKKLSYCQQIVLRITYEAQMQLQFHLRASLRLMPYELPCQMCYLQKLSWCRERPCQLHVVENFAELLKIMRSYTKDQGISSY